MKLSVTVLHRHAGFHCTVQVINTIYFRVRIDKTAWGTVAFSYLTVLNSLSNDYFLPRSREGSISWPPHCTPYYGAWDVTTAKAMRTSNKIGLVQKTTTSHVQHTFNIGTFLWHHCMTTTWNCLISDYPERKQMTTNFFKNLLFLDWDIFLRNYSTPGEFAFIEKVSELG